MQIQGYNREQLARFIESDHFKKLKRIPITPHRALSHIHNPDCSAEDVLLWVATEEDLLLGYVGVLPARLMMAGEAKQVYWLSCFWVDEACRHTHLASSLFFPLVKKYRGRLLISNFVPSLEKMYQRLGVFHPTVFQTGYRFYLAFCMTSILTSRFPRLSVLKPLLLGTDRFLNLVLTFRKLGYRQLERSFRFETDPSMDGALHSFLADFPKPDPHIHRGPGHFDWILSYPWVLQGNQDEESRRYFFSSRATRFELVPVKIFQEETLRGFMLLRIRDRTLTVAYLWAVEETMQPCAAFILGKTHYEQLDVITTFDVRLAAAIRVHRSRFVFLKKIRRPYIISDKLPVSSLSFQEGDGDAVFT